MENIAYEQSPGHFGGFGSDGKIITVADDFQLSQRTLIHGITWWGGYLSTQLSTPTDDNFTIRLFSDNGTTPGALIQTFNVGNNAARTPTGNFVNPPDPTSGFPGRAEFLYSVTLPIDFAAEANTRYWLSIVNVPSSDSWLWEVSGSQINLGVQRSFSDPVFGPWAPYYDNTAFRLRTAECGTCPASCDDGNLCTDDTCDVTTNCQCVHTPKNCNDNNLCTTDTCDPATGNCVHTPAYTCPTGMTCDPSTSNCVGCLGPCLPCTTDSQCGSNNACVTNRCVAGFCSTTLIRCNDNNACTTDTCDPVTGCKYTPKNCDDNNACTGPDSCDPATGLCVNPPLTGTPCDDGNPCTTGDVCSGGVCQGTPTDAAPIGIINTIAGNGTAGYSGDNGPATSASLYGPWGVAVDSLGNIYIADYYNHRIRKVDTAGTITTVAGNGTNGYSGDNGQATSASLNSPRRVAVDSAGNIYIADTFNPASAR